LTFRDFRRYHRFGQRESAVRDRPEELREHHRARNVKKVRVPFSSPGPSRERKSFRAENATPTQTLFFALFASFARDIVSLFSGPKRRLGEISFHDGDVFLQGWLFASL
jgi:hypothetical protein